jgi:DNA-binding response OmpR family regulator
MKDANHSVLIVEDDAEVASVLLSVVEHGGYHAVVADSPASARSAFQIHRPLCVLLDLGLPDVRSGIDLLLTLRREFGHEAVIIVVTGHTAKEIHEEVWAAGADHLITKPMRAETLARILEPESSRRVFSFNEGAARLPRSAA